MERDAWMSVQTMTNRYVFSEAEGFVFACQTRSVGDGLKLGRTGLRKGTEFGNRQHELWSHCVLERKDFGVTQICLRGFSRPPTMLVN